MKVLHLLLSIWILFCAGVPCEDELSYADSSYAVIHVDHTEQGHEHLDTCSPFCICSCCAVTSTLPKANSFFHKQPSIPVIRDLYICPPVTDYSNSFWQPPRHA